MKNKNKLKIIIPVLLVSSSVFVLFQIKNDLSLNQNSNQDSNNSINQNDQNITPTDFHKLTILENRCRGCGKCAQIDSSHFEMVGRIAKVISSNNLSSDNLQLAINNCHDQAIILE